MVIFHCYVKLPEGNWGVVEHGEFTSIDDSFEGDDD